MFFNQKNIWNWGAKPDFVIFHHMVVLNSRFALALTLFLQFQKLRLRWSMVFQGIWISIPKIYYFTFEKLNFSTFWGPSLNGFAKFVKINQFPFTAGWGWIYPKTMYIKKLSSKSLSPRAFSGPRVIERMPEKWVFPGFFGS